jgi:hypothetical protein
MSYGNFVLAFIKAISGKETSSEFVLDNVSFSLGKEKKAIVSVNGKIKAKILGLQEVSSKKKKISATR